MTPTPLRAAGEIDRAATNLADVPISMRRHASLIYVGFCRSADFSIGLTQLRVLTREKKRMDSGGRVHFFATEA